ncbi:hypothetical protein WMY93_007459 [Mugilogobius chulae]|uniref:Uncharacterized protein n=1 Tax=Mugilogobius chulae TaxID=88201 RepID=A0AAW0PJJ8_9GOBI
MTREVLTERKQLENLVENLRKQVQVGLCTLEQIRQTSQIVETHKAEISRNANFTFSVTVTEPRQIDISGTGVYLTNCQQCHYTCHDNCAYANDADKRHCCAMGGDGRVHFNQKYKWEYVQTTKTETIDDMKKKYDIAKGEKNVVETLLVRLKKDYEDVQVEVTLLIDQSSACLNRLKEIALKPDPLSAPEYIDMLIKAEKAEAKAGWQDRVDSLMAMKEKADYVNKVERGEALLEQVKTQPKPLSFFAKVTQYFKS